MISVLNRSVSFLYYTHYGGQKLKPILPEKGSYKSIKNMICMTVHDVNKKRMDYTYTYMYICVVQLLHTTQIYIYTRIATGTGNEVLSPPAKQC